MRFPIGSALQKFCAKLDEGDPVAIGLLGFAVLLATVVGIIWLVDQKIQAAEKKKGQGSRRKR
jgi:hypothetical protein